MGFDPPRWAPQLSPTATTTRARPGHLYLRRASGENDGLVPADSQRWGEVLCRIEADHWAQIGWSRHFDAAAFYDGLLRELRGRGL